jgi:hypothetical protein
MGETLEQLQKRAHSGHWSFDELLEWYYEQGKENQQLRGILIDLGDWYMADDEAYIPSEIWEFIRGLKKDSE